jgi:hypothetical protein
MAASPHQVGRIDRGPRGIVEVSGAGFGRVIVGAHWSARRLAVGARSLEVDLDDLRIAVSPFAFDERHALASREIDAGFAYSVVMEEKRRRRGQFDGLAGRRDPHEHAVTPAATTAAIESRIRRNRVGVGSSGVIDFLPARRSP